MTTFTADQLRSIINLSQDRYHECRTRDGIEAESTRHYAALNRTAVTMLHEATAPKYEYINTGRQVKLGDLVTSDDITDDTTIKASGVNGNFLARGKWYILAGADVSLLDSVILAFWAAIGNTNPSSRRTIRY